LPELPDPAGADRKEQVTGSGMETEIKLAVSDTAAVLRTVRAAGFSEASPRVFEANVLYDTQTGELRARGELLRLRAAGTRNVMTWKGKLVPGPHKSRPELEVEFADFSSMDTILQRLGYGPVFRYEKYRTEFRLANSGGVLTLDETPIGTWIELEGEADWIDSTARSLGFRHAEYITASYGTLYREHCEREGIKPAWMVFPS
jgi:adenylate cyclase class 2